MSSLESTSEGDYGLETPTSRSSLFIISSWFWGVYFIFLKGTNIGGTKNYGDVIEIYHDSSLDSSPLLLFQALFWFAGTAISS